MNAATRGLWHAVYDRSEGCCDLCRRPVLFDGPWQPHHRKLRSQGGTNDLANLLLLDVDCHLPKVHLRPTWAYLHGFLVESYFDPASRQVHRADGWYLPGDVWQSIPEGETA